MAWAPPQLDQRQLMTLMLAQQGIQGLGESFIRGDAMRRGAPVPRSTLPDPMHQMMQFQQMQQAAQQREAAKAAIGGLKTVPDDVKTLMSLYPEESIKPYIQGQLRPDRQQQDIWSSPAGLYSRSAGGIIPGTGPAPKEPGAPVVKEFTEGDRTVMKQWTGQGWETLSTAPRWQPQSAGGGPAPDRVLAIIPDENSPSGWTWAPRSQAVGKAAPVPSAVGAAETRQLKQEEKGQEKEAAASNLDASLKDIEAARSALEKNPRLGGASGFVQRQAEWLAGNVAPGAPQPARDLDHAIQALRNQNIEAILRQPSSRVSDSDMKRAMAIVGGTEKWDTPADAKRDLDWLQGLVKTARKNIGGPSGAVRPGAAPALPSGVTMEDVAFTAKQRGMTPEQVIEALRKKQGAP